MNPGEYPQPLVRRTVVNVPAISGYVASRLRSDDAFQPVISGEDTAIKVLFENVGTTAISLKLQQTNDVTVSGTRIDVISGVSLVPGGRRTVSSNSPFQKYLELNCYSGGPSNVRMQIDSIRKWEEMGFDKVNDATYYPTSLWQAKIPTLASLR